jgi:Xaa-Pro aminopeptidase
MKSDIDSLMQANQIDALMIVGAGQHNPSMVYLTGVSHLTGAELVKKCGEPPLLFHAPMERDEAARTGLRTRNYNAYPLGPLLKQTGNNRFKATVLRYQQMLSDAGITSGKVLVYGNAAAGTTFSLLSALQNALPGLEFSGDFDGHVLLQAMMTKDADEIEHIRQMGKITTEVVGLTADFLTSHKVKEGVLVTANGEPLRIKDVKNRINLWLAERGAENPEGTIFAIGRDAGVPHSSGNPEDPLSLGQTIVFDIFPCEAGGGYYYDFTRTWCLGYAPDAALKLYEDVLSVYRQVSQEMKANQACATLQYRTCALFEAQGHPTVGSNPETEEGYVHSLGHGVGLNIHEKPSSGSTATPTDILAPGVVFTVEPGLYYPERGLGVRLEDTVYVKPDGQIEVLAPYPLDLVLPIHQSR